MPRLAPAELSLREEEKEELQRLVNRHSTAQQIALRAQIILEASEGKNHTEIAKRLEISRDMARHWRNRWLSLSEREVSAEQKLLDEERSGGPMKFGVEQLVKLYAMACEPPGAYKRPISHWTAKELAQELIKQGIVESISTRHVGRLLKEADLKPHQSQYWLNPPPNPISRKKSKMSAIAT
jgi:putative transposase